MTVYDGVQEVRATNAHGEVNFLRIEKGSANLEGFENLSPEKGAFVVGHSESGNTHVLEAEGVTMKHHPGMDILYAIVKEPTALRQDAGAPHEPQIVQPGSYIITQNQEFDPFLQQARRVAD